MKGDFPQATETVPFQAAGLLHPLEHPFHCLTFGIQGFPLRPVPADVAPE